MVLTGDGKFFSAGLNVSEILDNDPGYANVVLDSLTSALLRLLRCPLPTVAAINGAAIAGGCLLPLACDRRLIAEDARHGGHRTEGRCRLSGRNDRTVAPRLWTAGRGPDLRRRAGRR